ncbi:MAG: amidophosphoribosyltransferase [Clostridia bacterium]|nr:amidophosphoribosyltransferase [Clostridia bacterium]
MKPNISFELIKPYSDRLPEECGVFGAYDASGHNVTDAVFYGLYALQHRGQESAGIASSDGSKISFHKDMGLVTEVFGDEGIDELVAPGHLGIGHVRYSTSGESQLINAQPLVISSKRGQMALAHNGNLINYKTLRDELLQLGHINQTTLDTEVIAHLLARYSEDTIENAIIKTSRWLKGSYALVIAVNDKLIGVRDPHGIRPLSLGRVGDMYVISSETCAMDAVNGEFIRDILPGEMVVISKDGVRSTMIEEKDHKKLCIFEFVYFARTDSHIDGISVYDARAKAGRILARKAPVDADIVAGVPDSAVTAALGYSEESGILYGEALAKNRYVGRTFIKPKQKVREQSVKVKLNALSRNVKGKKVVLVDDSIVRGTTSKKIVEMLREAGAREVHMRISSPPVKWPCYFGIDTPTADQLIGSSNSVDEICQLIGADSLEYLTAEDLLQSVNGSKNQFCMGCFDGDYPIKLELEKQSFEDM